MKNRLKYLLAALIFMLVGLTSRRYSATDSFIHAYLGDAIWAAMIYWGFRFLKPVLSPHKIAVVVTLFCFLIEISQLYQADWLNAIRHTRLGGLILGFGFLWSDFVMYSIGILVAWGLELVFMRNGENV